MNIATMRVIYRFVIGVLALLLISFFFLEHLISKKPSERPFKGFALVVVNLDWPRENQIYLRLRTNEDDRLSRTPEVNYDILACGTKPFTAALMLGGDARVNKAELSSQPQENPTTNAPPLTVKKRIETRDDDSGADVQVLLLEGKPTASCPPLSGGSVLTRVPPPGARLSGYRSFRLHGHLQAPIVHRYSMLGVKGASEWQAWPTIGDLKLRASPSDPDYLVEPFTWYLPAPKVGTAPVDKETSGHWTLPEGTWFSSFGRQGIASYKRTIAPDLADGIDAWVFDLESRIDVARPQPIVGSTLTWDLDYPAAPVLKITNTDRLAYLQGLQVRVSFFLGILVGTRVSGLCGGVQVAEQDVWE
jgi:hypothetical protein